MVCIDRYSNVIRMNRSDGSELEKLEKFFDMRTLLGEHWIRNVAVRNVFKQSRPVN